MFILSFGLVGYGYWGPNLARVIHNTSTCSFSALCDLDKSNLDKCKQIYPHILATADYNEILNNPDIDAIFIATPVHTHYSLAKQALLKNKHVFIEKPITSNTFEAKQLQLLAKEKNKILMAGHTFIYSGPVIKIKEIIQEGTIGDPLYFHSNRVNLGKCHADVNVIWDLAAHDFSILEYLFESEISWAQVTGKKFVDNKNECLAYINLELENKVYAHMHVSWISPIKSRSIVIGGTKGMITYDDHILTDKVRVYDKQVSVDHLEQFTYKDKGCFIPNIDLSEPLSTEIKHFQQCILHNRQPITDIRFGLKVLKGLELTDISLANQGRKVFAMEHTLMEKTAVGFKQKKKSDVKKKLKTI